MKTLYSIYVWNNSRSHDLTVALGLHKCGPINNQSWTEEELMGLPAEMLATDGFWGRGSHCLQL